jgi:hypothetical protein
MVGSATVDPAGSEETCGCAVGMAAAAGAAAATAHDDGALLRRQALVSNPTYKRDYRAETFEPVCVRKALGDTMPKVGDCHADG